MFLRKCSCENTRMADKLGHCAIILESTRQVSLAVIEVSLIEAFQYVHVYS